MIYTVKQLAKKAQISVRTLHYYDQIGLFKPSSVKNNGYRIYEDKELLKLQQILFFRELDFPLDEIMKMMNSKNFNEIDVLKDQKKLLLLKKERLVNLINMIDKTIHNLKGDETIKNDDLFASFNDGELTAHMKEAKKRWGNTEAYKQSMERTKHWTKKDYERIKEEGKVFTQKLADAMDKDVKSEEVQSLIDEHHKGIEYFYECPPEMYRNLGKMYMEDKRFTAYYDKFRPGLAQFVCDAITYYCDRKAK